MALLPALLSPFTVSVQAKAPPSRTPVVVEGVAATKDGQPLANATLFLEELAPSAAGSSTDNSELTVVTDGSGHFRWTAPANYSVVPNVTVAPKCRALATDRSAWNYSIQPDPGWTAANSVRPVLESATRECATHWIHQGPSVLMAVTVPDMTNVTMSVCDPDGHPIRDHVLQVFRVGTGMDGFGAVVYEGKTNRDGAVKVRCFTGVARLQAFVPGVGFLSTGNLDLRAGKEIAAQVPRLCPFARISGSLAVPIISGSAGVRLDDYGFSEHRWYRPTAQIDASGKWEITDLLPGQHRLAVTVGEKIVNAREVTAGAGESLTGIRLTARATATASPQALYSSSPVSLLGTVTDGEGHLEAGVVVYAVCPNNGFGNWGYQKVLKATTDDKGQYVIPDLPGMQAALSARLVAGRKGFGIAEASPLSEIGTDGTHGRADLILPPASTGLTVRVLQGNLPVANASVILSPAGDSLLEPASPRFRPTGDLGEVTRLLEPSGVTDGDGYVTIKGLSPGLWDIAATSGPDAFAVDLQGGISWPPGARSTAAIGIARNVSVREGKTGAFSLGITNTASTEVALRVLGPDGRPPVESLANIMSGPAAPWGWGSSPAKLDSDGNGVASVGSTGLWRVGASFRDNDMKSFSQSEPYYFAQTVFAVSPAVPMPDRVVLKTMPRGLGSLRFRVEDATGKPVRAAITVDDISDAAAYGGSTDGHGDIEFTDVPSGNYTIRTRILDLPAAPSSRQEDDPLPDDTILSRTVEIAPKFVLLAPEQDAKITLRAESQRYIRGWLRAEGQPEDYVLQAIASPLSLGRFHIDPLTGEFVVGPIPSGKTTIILSRSGVPGSRWQVDVDVTAARVAHVTLVPEGLADSSKPAVDSAPVLKMAVVQNTYAAKNDHPLTGTVFLADGTTPAWGARLAVSTKASSQSLLVKRTDATGKPTSDITPRWEPYRFRSPQSPGEPESDEPVVLVWLPGATGAAVFPYDSTKPIHAVLPAPNELRGRLTLGLKSIAGDVSTFRVAADYQGRGRLDKYLSVETTAQADGSFVLAGLTPGIYRVQAVRDGIWLSAAQTLTVQAGTSLPDLALDIPMPGQAVDLRLTDAKGAPLAGAVVSIDRPVGPLTDAVWPTTFTADGAGNLHLEGLNGGPETITVYAAPERGRYDTGVPTRKPIRKIVIDVPVFVAGRPAVARTIRCDQSSRLVYQP